MKNIGFFGHSVCWIVKVWTTKRHNLALKWWSETCIEMWRIAALIMYAWQICVWQSQQASSLRPLDHWCRLWYYRFGHLWSSHALHAPTTNLEIFIFVSWVELYITFERIPHCLHGYTVHQCCQMLYCPTGAFKYIKPLSC